MNTNSGTLPQKAIAGYSGSYSGIFKTMVTRINFTSIRNYSLNTNTVLKRLTTLYLYVV